MRVVFWQNIPSFHQSAHIRALAAMCDYDVTLAVREELPRSLIERGWPSPDFGNAKVIYSQNDTDINTLIAEAGENAIHIFSGIRFPVVRKAFLGVIKTKACIGLLSEAADWRGAKGFARLCWYKVELHRFRSKIDFILAIGDLGVKWFSKCGFPAEKIYPFLYVVEKPSVELHALASTSGDFRLVFVGQCIHRKGIDILISALHGLRDKDWRLDIVGDGIQRPDFERQAKEAGLAHKIVFHGAMKNNEAQKIIAPADLLVLPSRWDGWGAVVNEALMQGVPAICSDLCGAADLVNNPERGGVFKAGSVASLKTLLERCMKLGRRSLETTMVIREWSRAVEGEVAALYIRDVIDAAQGLKPRPIPQWQEG